VGNNLTGYQKYVGYQEDINKTRAVNLYLTYGNLMQNKEKMLML
jgi:hypothetical protein